MDFAFYLDLLMIVLLVVTIVYAIILNRKLAAFRRSREDMQNFLTAFNAANERAESSITALKDMAEQSGEKLRENIEKASGLNEDLSFMVDRGESIANRLEKAASDANAVRRSGVSGAAASASAGAGASDGARAGKSGGAGLGGMMGGGADRPDVIDDRDRDRVGVETRAEELAARMVGEFERSGNAMTDREDGSRPASAGNGSGSYGDGNGGSDLYDQDEDAGRSEAERELLAALRSVR
ncbi:DUF6468 domain-containing protein [Thalassospira sp. GO-4]|jgi:hypothetical protein|uniref:DUF6468 domain-containing protein n=1 Tax=Thalassospira sp. GO-4 TaxID=2946605 RepID=UPI00202504D7|nr:DUF6468 domain-containing protein [Thalassospira sp. GO-4]URK19624.1 DUF6468 domain-containing protein [Thalassospira sp. GO-4]